MVFDASILFLKRRKRDSLYTIDFPSIDNMDNNLFHNGNGRLRSRKIQYNFFYFMENLISNS